MAAVVDAVLDSAHYLMVAYETFASTQLARQNFATRKLQTVRRQLHKRRQWQLIDHNLS